MNITPTSCDTFCPLPWIHLHSWPNGKAMLCCVAHGGENAGEIGNFLENTYAEIMNSDKLKQVRLDMLSGRRVEQCSSCYRDEDLGRTSYRQHMLNNTSGDPMDVVEFYAKDTNEDGSVKQVKMAYMDYRFSNLCNLKCKSCGPDLSSSIANSNKDENVLSVLRDKGVLSERETITSYIYKRKDFMDVDVFPYINDDLKTMYFAGGEPLIMPEHHAILKYLDDNQMYDKQLVYSTNMTTFNFKGTDFVDIWKNFDSIRWMASIDGHGPALECIRTGAKPDVVFGNLIRLLDLRDSNPDKNFKIIINYTHSIFNAYTTGDFFNYLDETGLLDRLDTVELNYAYADNNSISILPDFAKEELKIKRQETLSYPGMQKAFAKWENLESIYRIIDDIIDQPSPQYDMFKNLIAAKYKDDLQFRNTLPWLYSVIQRINSI